MTNKRISKRQWLDKALNILEQSGIEAVKIDRLAKELNVSRSGFYYHFKDRQDLLQHVLDFWTNEYTGVVTSDLSLKEIKADERLLAIMKMIKEKNLTKYDLALNLWARNDPQASEALKIVVAMRLDYLREIFRELGISGDELEMRTKLFVCYQSWESTMFGDDDKTASTNQQLLFHKFIKNI